MLRTARPRSLRGRVLRSSPRRPWQGPTTTALTALRVPASAFLGRLAIPIANRTASGLDGPAHGPERNAPDRPPFEAPCLAPGHCLVLRRASMPDIPSSIRRADSSIDRFAGPHSAMPSGRFPMAARQRLVGGPAESVVAGLLTCEDLHWTDCGRGALPPARMVASRALRALAARPAPGPPEVWRGAGVADRWASVRPPDKRGAARIETSYLRSKKSQIAPFNRLDALV